MNRYFITGTDTDCGKTFVTCQLLDWFNSRQQTAQALKPVASGSLLHDGRLINEDVRRLQQHNYAGEQTIVHKCYEPPVSPHIAARLVNDSLSAAELVAFSERPEFSDFEHLLIEGAGGLMVPLNDKETWLDFLCLANIPVILVVGMRLGCINHALLSDFVLKANKIPCIGWIANTLDQDMLVYEENIATLTARMHMPLIATVAYGGPLVLKKNSLV